MDDVYNASRKKPSACVRMCTVRRLHFQLIFLDVCTRGTFILQVCVCVCLSLFLKAGIWKGFTGFAGFAEHHNAQFLLQEHNKRWLVKT